MKKQSRIMSLLLITVLLVSVFAAGCGTTPAPEPQDEPGLKVGIVLSSGGKGDKSFNDAAIRGLDMAVEEALIEAYDYTEPSDISKDEESLRFYAEEGYDLVVAVGFMMQSALETVSAEFPDVNFAIIDAVVESPNVASLVFKEEEGSFLAGVLAAQVTGSQMQYANGDKVVGFVGGMDMPLIHKFQEGFEQGVAYVDSEIEVLVNYAGTEPSAFNDPQKGKELAKAMYEAGADIIFHASGGTGAGVFEAAEENGAYAIGVDSDQNWMKPGFVLASMLKKVDIAVLETTRDVAEESFGGGVHTFDAKGNGVGLTDLRDVTVVEQQAADAGDITAEQLETIKAMKADTPAEFADMVDDAKAKITSGEIMVEVGQ